MGFIVSYVSKTRTVVYMAHVAPVFPLGFFFSFSDGRRCAPYIRDQLTLLSSGPVVAQLHNNKVF